jgi:hypothetical protein
MSNRITVLLAMVLLLAAAAVLVSLNELRPGREKVVVAAPMPTDTPSLGGKVVSLSVPSGVITGEATVLHYAVQDGYVLVDEDGDAFLCPTIPQTWIEMKACSDNWR